MIINTTKALLAVLVAGVGASESGAALSLNIDIFTTDEIKFTISGTFDEDVIGDQRGWLAVKNDWSNNFGTNNGWIDDSVGFFPVSDADWMLIENTVTIGSATIRSFVAASGQTWGDSIYFGDNEGMPPILAGTAVSGTFHAQGDNLFTVVKNLELLSGFDDQSEDWTRLEATAVPAPSALALLCLAGAATTRRRRT